MIVSICCTQTYLHTEKCAYWSPLTLALVCVCVFAAPRFMGDACQRLKLFYQRCHIATPTGRTQCDTANVCMLWPVQFRLRPFGYLCLVPLLKIPSRTFLFWVCGNNCSNFSRVRLLGTQLNLDLGPSMASCLHIVFRLEISLNY